MHLQGVQYDYYENPDCAHQMNLDYFFEDEVYEGEIYIEGRIFLFYIVYMAVRLYLNKSVRRLIFD